ncbi:hypothetical protein HHK36_028807 [Tetracentron sinense]|uniref:Glyoxylate reductase n=1 Tax=Tetracentron sinense TaxID=13715 RepID=A0A834YBT2_TETSI|nr:hypothetical protein HHK36_028807 [Tetracentron sinense]
MSMAARGEEEAKEELNKKELPWVLIIRPPSPILVFEEQLLQKFQLLDPLKSSLPTHIFLTTQAHSVRALLCLGLCPVDSETLRCLPSLECVVASSAGVDHVDVAECRRRGIRVTNAGEALSEDAADYAVALLIDVLRRISAADRFVRTGLWPLKGEYPLGSKYDGSMGPLEMCDNSAMGIGYRVAAQTLSESAIMKASGHVMSRTDCISPTDGDMFGVELVMLALELIGDAAAGREFNDSIWVESFKTACVGASGRREPREDPWAASWVNGVATCDDLDLNLEEESWTKREGMRWIDWVIPHGAGGARMLIKSECYLSSTAEKSVSYCHRVEACRRNEDLRCGGFLETITGGVIHPDQIWYEQFELTVITGGEDDQRCVDLNEAFPDCDELDVETCTPYGTKRKKGQVAFPFSSYVLPHPTTVSLLHDLGGKQVGIVGLGSIGSKVAKRLEAFGCSISYNSRKKKQSVPFPYYSNVSDLAANTDVLVISCALTDQTHHIINKNVMSALGKEGVIINIGRGALIDEKEMVRCLVEGEIGGAGLDVFENEPDVPKELLALDNVVLSPHRAVLTPESFSGVQELMIANLEAFFSNEPLHSLVKD